jgi:hypothetical protein
MPPPGELEERVRVADATGSMVTSIPMWMRPEVSPINEPVEEKQFNAQDRELSSAEQRVRNSIVALVQSLPSCGTHSSWVFRRSG